MSEVKISIRDNGPLLVEGSFTLVDAAGNVFTLPTDKPAFALCRCGASARKPFCDGSHKTACFESAVRALGG
jgi:CDGSH-type Zn-finger protein